jgi:peptidoglycan hydrolase CwlO-like protein
MPATLGAAGKLDRMCHHCGDFVTIGEALARIEQKQGAIMTAQDDINAAVVQLQATQANEAAAVSALGSDVTAIQAELAAGGQPDTSALNAAVAAQPAADAALAAAVGDVTALVPGAQSPAG